MSAVLSQPTMLTTLLADGTKVTIEHLPELAHRGRRYHAYCTSSPNGIDAYAGTETGAIDALQEAIDEEMARRQDLAEHGELPWYLQ